MPDVREDPAPPAAASRPLAPCRNRDTGLFGLCRADGSTAPPVVAQTFDFIGAGADLFPARQRPGDPMGYIDAEGRWRIPARYASAASFSEQRAVVTEGGRSAAIDPAGRIVVDWFDGMLFPYRQGLACYLPGGRIEHTVFGRMRHRLFGTQGEDPYAAAWWNMTGLAGFLDPDGKVAIAPRFRPKLNFLVSGCGFGSSGFAAMRTDAPDDRSAREGLIDRTGRWVIAPEFDYLGMVFSGNRRVVAVIADRRIDSGPLLDTVERLDGFMGPDGRVRWRETGPPRRSPVAGGLLRTLANPLLFPRWQQDLTRQDPSGTMLAAWIGSLVLGPAVLAGILRHRGLRTRPRWARLAIALAAACLAMPVVFLAGLVSAWVTAGLVAAGGAVFLRARWRRRRAAAAAPSA